MTKPIKDFSLTLSESIHAALEADAIAYDKTMQMVAREVLQDWADRKHHAYTVYGKRLLANGMQTELPGFETGEDGARRKRHK